MWTRSDELPHTGQLEGSFTAPRSYQPTQLTVLQRVPSEAVSAPVLLLGFNRPDRLIDLIDSLRPTAPPVVRIAVDGHRADRPGEAELVAACRATAELVDWTTDVEVLERSENLGLERAIPDAVSWVLTAHESVIVIEDDVTIGPQFIDFAQAMLTRFEDDDSIMHVSGYNVVPRQILSSPEETIRLSRVPESFAWATWRRAWSHYDADLTWARSCSMADLHQITGSRLAALRWRQNFVLAERRLISTWAYRWLASMWSHDGWCVSPNRNLITYRGYTGGTHTRRKAHWTELPIEKLDLDPPVTRTSVDHRAERYLHGTVFSANPLGVALGPAERLALRVTRRR